MQAPRSSKSRFSDLTSKSISSERFSVDSAASNKANRALFTFEKLKKSTSFGGRHRKGNPTPPPPLPPHYLDRETLNALPRELTPTSPPPSLPAHYLDREFLNTLPRDLTPNVPQQSARTLQLGPILANEESYFSPHNNCNATCQTEIQLSSSPADHDTEADWVTEVPSRVSNETTAPHWTRFSTHYPQAGSSLADTSSYGLEAEQQPQYQGRLFGLYNVRQSSATSQTTVQRDRKTRSTFEKTSSTARTTLEGSPLAGSVRCPLQNPPCNPLAIPQYSPQYSASFCSSPVTTSPITTTFPHDDDNNSAWSSVWSNVALDASQPGTDYGSTVRLVRTPVETNSPYSVADATGTRFAACVAKQTTNQTRGAEQDSITRKLNGVKYDKSSSSGWHRKMSADRLRKKGSLPSWREKINVGKHAKKSSTLASSTLTSSHSTNASSTDNKDAIELDDFGQNHSATNARDLEAGLTALPGLPQSNRTCASSKVRTGWMWVVEKAAGAVDWATNGRCGMSRVYKAVILLFLVGVLAVVLFIVYDAYSRGVGANGGEALR